MDGKAIIILLVEDDPAHAEIVRRNFETFRVANRLVHVPDGQAALDYIYRSDEYQDHERYPEPDLVLLDLRLPKIDGLEVLKTIKSDPEKRQLPIIILTTSAAEADIARAYNNHANSYLVKPVDFNQFITLMENLGYYWLMWNTFPFQEQ
jgi:CheY-like chemotaxis protein